MNDTFVTIAEAKQSIVDEFSLFDDWVDRYEYIIELGKALEGLPEECQTEQFRVKGCQSQVWFRAHNDDGRIIYEADSDAIIVRGLVALLLRVYSNRLPDEVLSTSPDFFDAIELGSHLSGSRANGLHAMVTRIHAYAKAFRDKDSPGTEALA